MNNFKNVTTKLILISMFSMAGAWSSSSSDDDSDLDRQLSRQASQVEQVLEVLDEAERVRDDLAAALAEYRHVAHQSAAALVLVHQNLEDERAQRQMVEEQRDAFAQETERLRRTAEILANQLAQERQKLAEERARADRLEKELKAQTKK